MNGDDHVQFAVALAPEPLVEARDGALDCLRRLQCEPGSPRRLMVEPEQSADAVESDRGERSARAEDGLAYRVAIKREQVKEILRQLFPRQLLAIEKIAEHQDDVALGGALPGRRPIDRRRGAHQGHDR